MTSGDQDVEFLSFSVPALTALWIRLVLQALPGPDRHVIVGDCSGGLQDLVGIEKRLRVVRVRNSPHGLRLDRATRISVPERSRDRVRRRRVLVERPAMAVERQACSEGS